MIPLKAPRFTMYSIPVESTATDWTSLPTGKSRRGWKYSLEAIVIPAANPPPGNKPITLLTASGTLSETAMWRTILPPSLVSGLRFAPTITPPELSGEVMLVTVPPSE